MGEGYRIHAVAEGLKMILRALSLVTVCLLWGITCPPERLRADEWIEQLFTRYPPTQTGGSLGTHLSPSARQTATTDARPDLSDDSISLHLHDSQPSDTELIEYPSCVSHDPGKPGMRCFPLLANIHKTKSTSKRYDLPNCERAGHPHEVAWWAGNPINKNYSAAFVGGGTPWVLAHKTRSRAHDEGTWGLDYDGLFKPRRVWLQWSCDREQGGLGSYATDGAPAIVERLSKGK